MRLHATLLRNLALLLLCWSATPARSQQVTVEATITPNQARPNQVVTYSIRVSGGQPDGQPVLRLPLQIGQNSAASTSQQYSIVNGQASSSTTFSWGLTGTEPGEFVIAPQEVRVGGQSFQTNEVKLTVQQGGDPQTQNLAEGDQPKLQLILEKSEVYRGEVIPIRAALMVPRNMVLRRLGLIDIDKSDFAIQRFPQQSEQSQAVVDGVGYNIYTFRSTLSPLQTGDLDVGPASQEIIAEVIDRNRSMNSPFGSQFGFAFREPQKFTVTSESTPLRVLPLPSENRPDDFSGAVGDFTLRVQASPTADLKVGDPISVELTLEGIGNFDAITDPRLSDATGWKTYPTRRYNVDGQVDPNRIQSLQQRLGISTVIVPESAHAEIPSYEVSFFSPTQKDYVTLKTDPIPLQITVPDPAQQDPSVAPLAGAPSEISPIAAVRPRPDLSDIVTETPESPQWVAAKDPSLRQSPLFWTLNALPVLALLGAIGFTHFRQQAEARNRGPLGEVNRSWAAVTQSRGDDSAYLQQAMQFLAVTQRVAPDLAAESKFDLIRQSYSEHNFRGPISEVTGLDDARKTEIHQLLQELKARATQSLQQTPSTAVAKTATWIGAALLLTSGTGFAVERTEAYQAARQALAEGKYKEAQYVAEKLVEAEPPELSPDLFQLIGHARYRSEDQGRATLWYRRAELFDPRSAEVRQNLRHLDEQNRFLQFNPPSPFVQWSAMLTENEWLQVASAGFWLLLLPLAWHRLRGRASGGTSAVSLGGAVLLAIGVTFLTLRPDGSERVDRLHIVTEKDSRAFTAATQTAGSVIDLPPGSEARVLEVRGSWSYCELPGATEPLRGWVENDVMEPLWPFDSRWIP